MRKTLKEFKEEMNELCGPTENTYDTKKGDLFIVKSANEWMRIAAGKRLEEEGAESTPPTAKKEWVHPGEHEEQSFFKVLTANEWVAEAEKEPVPRMLMSELWYEGEICILFADTNVGKSILAVQIADSISRGVAIDGFKLEAEKQKVIYFDFELSKKQFQARYSDNYRDKYIFDNNFYRAEINPDGGLLDGFDGFDEYLYYSLEDHVVRLEASILIVDNLTYLRHDNERAKDALALMKQLKAMKSRYGLSILALAHTPKRDSTKPITKNDLQGSKMLINFCDSSFAIGESQSERGLRYLKQVKVRNAVPQ